MSDENNQTKTKEEFNKKVMEIVFNMMETMTKRIWVTVSDVCVVSPKLPAMGVSFIFSKPLMRPVLRQDWSTNS